MKLKDRITVLSKLGDQLLNEKNDFLEAVMLRIQHKNYWYTFENSQHSIQDIAQAYLQKEALEKWTAHYHINDSITPKNVGIVLNDVYPLDGFHDFVATFIVGHVAQIKLSDNDIYLFPHLLKMLTDINPDAAQYFSVVERLEDFDAIIVNGSPKSTSVLETYFKNYPYIIEPPRHTVAVFKGNETADDIRKLGKDIFQYFGLSNRSISKIYIPEGYEIEPVLEVLHENKKIILNTKYKNNFDYNFAIFMMNNQNYRANGCIIMKEDKAIQSRIACLHYEYYTDLTALNTQLATQKQEIQAIVAQKYLLDSPTIPFGAALELDLMSYSNEIDTINFLLSIA